MSYVDDYNTAFSKVTSGPLTSAQFATLQTPSAQNNAANSVSASYSGPAASDVKLPSWLTPNADGQMGELLNSYAGIQTAFDPTSQIAARNNAIGYNTSAGNQAANNAASEFASRAQQQGGSALGAGVVKAQALMPVLQQNAQLKTDSADIAAKAHQDAASLASQVASTIGQLRMSYLNTLTGYTTGQQQLGLDTYKATQAVAGDAANRQLSYAQLRAQQETQRLSASQTANQAGLTAAQALLASKGPSGNFVTNNQGQVTSGQNVANSLTQWNQSRNQATSYLQGLL